MSKYLKSIIIAALAVCMMVCLGIFAAGCIEDEPEGNYFTVTVEKPDHTKVKDVEIDICTLDGSLETCLERPTKTDDKGVAKFNLKEPADVSDSTKFLVKITNSTIPEGFIYADDNGDAYDYKNTAHQGRVFDTTVTTKSVTITLTAVGGEQPPVVTDTNVTLGTPKALVANGTYSFTATEAGDYLFTVSKNQSGLTLKGNAVAGSYSVLTVAKDEVVSVTVNENCNILVTKNVTAGSEASPVAITLGEEKTFTKTVFTKAGMLYGSEVCTWVDGDYYLTFAASYSGDAEEYSGKYKVTVTSLPENYTVNADIRVINDEIATPDELGNNTFGNIKLNNEYKVVLSADYSDVPDGTVISYTVKVEYVADGGSEENTDWTLHLNANDFAFESEADYGVKHDCTFTGEAGKTYTVSVSDKNFTTLNDVCPATDIDLTADADGVITFTVQYDGWDESLTITITEKVAS